MSKTLISSLEKGDSIGKNIINSYFLDQKNLVRHQIDSYDNFLENKIYEIFHEYNSNSKNIIYSDFDRDLGRNKYEYHIKFDNITISKPIIQDNQNIKRQMFPNDARLQNLPYSVVVKVDVYHKLVEIQSDGSEQCKEFEPLRQHTIGKIPLMLQSKYCVLSEQSGKTRSEMGECEYDYGGYFIVNGNEKVVIFQERKAENQVFCFAQGKGQTKFSHKCEISSSDESNPYNVKNVEVKLTAKEGNIGKTVKVKIQGMRQELPLFVIFRCLGIVSDKQIMEYIFYNLDLEDYSTLMEMLRPSIKEAEPIQDEQTALEYASKYITLSPNVKPTNFQKDEYKLWYTKNLILDELLPHLGKDAKKKGFFLGYMVYRLLYSVVTDTYSERDSFLNKRVDTTGDLMSYLFRTNFKKMMKDVEQGCRTELAKKRFDDLASGLGKKIKKNQIESGMKYALSTGNWGLQNKETKKGIAQVLSRLSYLSFISHLRRMSAPMSKTLKSVDPRVLHGTQWGTVCPFETPEGQPIGLSKNLALMTQVTIGHSTEPIRYYLRKLGMLNLEDVTPASVFGQCKVFINGDWIGVHLQPQELVKELKIYRRKGLINIYTSISWDVETNELYLQTDAGRLCRPLLIVEDNKLKITPAIIKKLKEGEISFDDLFVSEDGNAYLEYIDTNEANRCMISLKKEDLEANSLKNEVYYNYTHCEISQDSIFGVVAQTIPLCDHQQAPRVLFYSAQAKQAIGIYATNFEDRFDVMGNSLYYPHKRLLSTDNSEYVNVNKIPNGQNVVVAIAMYGGWNQEDSLIVNKSSLERGMFITSYFRTYIGKEQKNSNTLEEEKFQRPVKYNPNGTPLTAGMREGASYGKLQDNGFVKEGTKVDGGDAIIGKVIPLKTQSDDDIKFRDASTFVKATEKGTVDKVYVNKDGEGFKFAKVRVRSERIPEIGDKYCLMDSAEVLTEKGWINITQVSTSDKVATLVDGKKLEYVNPIETYKFDYEGDIYKLRSQQVDLDVTVDHELYVKRRDKKEFELIPAARVMNKRVRFKKNAIKEGEDIKYKEINGNNYDMDAYLELLGIFLSDGFIAQGRITLCGEKERKINHIYNVCERLGLSLISDKNKESHLNSLGLGCQHYFRNKDIEEDLSKVNVGVLNKFIPEWVWGLNQRQSRILLESLLSCDGSKNPQGSVCYYTSSKKLADDVMKLSIHAGWSGSIKTLREKGTEWNINGRTGVLTEDTLIVRIVKKKNEPQINHGHIKDQNGQSEELYYYKGNVYCLQVPSHVFMVRQNNKNVWVGNCSSYGQKGTCGIVYTQEDMPFTKNGMTPDLIITPLAIPTRMTIGQLIECVMLKVSARKAHAIDGTPFTNLNPNDIADMLEKCGLERNGTEIMYNGKTGEQMEAAIFVGPTYYHRLKHMVQDKLHSRSSGPYQLLTRQPAEGRAKDGGLRLGEMERDAELSHGAVQFLKERMFDVSDKYFVTIDKKTGMIAPVNKERGIYKSLYSDNTTDFVRVQIPYATKLFIQELYTMGITTKLMTGSSDK